MGDKLGLSAEVVGKIKDLSYRTRKARIEIDGRLQAARLDLEMLLDKPIPERAVVMKQLEQVSSIQLERRKLTIGLLLDVGALLTPEQRREFQSLVRARRGKRQGHRGGQHKRHPR